MGISCDFYIGSTNYSWKSVVPEFLSLLFTPFNYVAVLHEEDKDYGDWYEHKFISNCDKAATQLLGFGIDLKLLRNLHFNYFSFDYDEYKESLEYRCQSYLQSTSESGFADATLVEKMTRRLLRNFKLLPPDEEFAIVLKAFEKKGSSKDYIEMLERAIKQKEDEKKESHTDFDKTNFYRDFLLDFLKENPYLRHHGDAGAISGYDDLDLLYNIGLSIFASKPDVPIELDITEFEDVHKPMTTTAVEAFIFGQRSFLKKRTLNLAQAFGLVSTEQDNMMLGMVSIEKGKTSTAKEKGDLLEDLITQIFASQKEFKVKTNIRRRGEEIDLVIINKMQDPFWTALHSPTILVECKNQAKKVEPKDLRNFEVKIIDRKGLCKLGVIISTSGFTKGCYVAATKCGRDGYNIILIDNKQLQKRIENKLSTADWLEEIILEQC
jgi:hypothetical protein